MARHTVEESARLAQLASHLTDLPVHRQFQILADRGFRLSNTGWGKLNDPEGEGLQKYVTVIPVRKTG